MSDHDHDLDRLVALHLDDALDITDAQRLHELLRTDVQARRLLLSAATHAAVLPRVALESGLAQASGHIPLQRRMPRRLWWSAAAAMLLVGVGMWWSLSDRALPDVQLAARSDVVVMRGDQRLNAHTATQVGDRLDVGAGGTRLEWSSEGTAIDLTDGAHLVIEELGAHKRLRLEQGALTADVAPQGSGSLSVTTPFGVVEVVGTRFRVQVDAQSSQVAVDHGVVRVSGAPGSTPVEVRAGYAVTLSTGRVSAPGPSATMPGPAITTATPSASVVRLGVENFRAADGWEGDLIDGAIHARAVSGSPVMRITTPLHRPDGIARFDPTLRMTIALTADHPTTLALLLVCDHPDGGSRWLANLQAEQKIPAGAQQVTFSAADFHLTTAGPQPPSGSRVVAVALMTWQPAAHLRLQWIELGR